jgi:hypothetical protein
MAPPILLRLEHRLVAELAAETPESSAPDIHGRHQPPINGLA